MASGPPRGNRPPATAVPPQFATNQQEGSPASQPRECYALQLRVRGINDGFAQIWETTDGAKIKLCMNAIWLSLQSSPKYKSTFASIEAVPFSCSVIHHWVDSQGKIGGSELLPPDITLPYMDLDVVGQQDSIESLEAQIALLQHQLRERLKRLAPRQQKREQLLAALPEPTLSASQEAEQLLEKSKCALVKAVQNGGTAEEQEI